MVMGRVRAASYVRRTLSLPVNKHRPSAVTLAQQDGGLRREETDRSDGCKLHFLCRMFGINNGYLRVRYWFRCSSM